ncbi:MAG TPA: hypothetical protein DEH24_20345 [Alteromonas sp.]|nr:hypothetical protein [Alteromonas sp.]
MFLLSGFEQKQFAGSLGLQIRSICKPCLQGEPMSQSGHFQHRYGALNGNHNKGRDCINHLSID